MGLPGYKMVDIHSHLLPGLDDGPRTLAESLRMCELYLCDGVAAVIATPHMNAPLFTVSSQAVRRGVEELRAECRQRGLNLEILPGADVRPEPGLVEIVERGEVLTLADTGRYLLLELPLETAPRIEGLVFDLLVRGVTPVLSHPERNVELWRKTSRLAELVDQGCLVQVTAGSLFNGFGPWARQAAERFLRDGLVHVVATDAHSAHGRQLQLGRAAGYVAALMGKEKARELLETNPRRILRGELLTPSVATGGTGGKGIGNGPGGVLRQ
jgi:protein-tyrosine phosphatase